jgi:hypothetical protein
VLAIIPQLEPCQYFDKQGLQVHLHIHDTAYDYCGGASFSIQKHTVGLPTQNPRA